MIINIMKERERERFFRIVRGGNRRGGSKIIGGNTRRGI